MESVVNKKIKYLQALCNFILIIYNIFQTQKNTLNMLNLSKKTNKCSATLVILFKNG